jgi:hypothetical protein
MGGTKAFRSPYAMDGISFKNYPLSGCCFVRFPLIDALQTYCYANKIEIPAFLAAWIVRVPSDLVSFNHRQNFY